MDIKDLETALSYFYSNREHYKYHEDLYKHLNSIKPFTIIEVLLILEKLCKDGYIREEPQQKTTRDATTHVVKRVETLHGYHITYDGILFVEAPKGEFEGRPYHYHLANERRKENALRKENWPKRNWYWMSLITLITGLLVGIALKWTDRIWLQDKAKSTISIPIVSDTLILRYHKAD